MIRELLHGWVMFKIGDLVIPRTIKGSDFCISSSMEGKTCKVIEVLTNESLKGWDKWFITYNNENKLIYKIEYRNKQYNFCFAEHLTKKQYKNL